MRVTPFFTTMESAVPCVNVSTDKQCLAYVRTSLIAFSFVHAYQHDSTFEHGSRWPWRVRNCFQVICAGDNLLLLLARCTACVCAALVCPHARARARGCEQHATLIRNGVWRVPIARSLAAGSMDALPFCARSRSMYTLASSLRHKTETQKQARVRRARRDDASPVSCSGLPPHDAGSRRMHPTAGT